MEVLLNWYLLTCHETIAFCNGNGWDCVVSHDLILKIHWFGLRICKCYATFAVTNTKNHFRMKNMVSIFNFQEQSVRSMNQSSNYQEHNNQNCHGEDQNNNNPTCFTRVGINLLMIKFLPRTRKLISLTQDDF